MIHHKKEQKKFREKSNSYSQIKRAALFYVLNRTSYSGTTLSGGMAVDKQKKGWSRTNPRFNHNAIKKGGSSIKNFKNITGINGHFQDEFAVYDQKGKTCPTLNCNKKILFFFFDIVSSAEQAAHPNKYLLSKLLKM